MGGSERRARVTSVTDVWLQGIAAEAFGADPQNYCVVAVGSYGRSELSLRSDLDVVLLHSSRADEASRVADALWYPMWDSGISIDHSVRSFAEARRLAHSDIKVLLGLLDARVVAGNSQLGSDLRSAVLADWRARASSQLPALFELVQERRSRSGDLAQLLEPDVKESYGGIRDATILRAIAASWLVDVPHTGWEHAWQQLLDVRDAADEISGRHRLMQQDQAAVASSMGFVDADDLLRQVYLAARTIAFASDTAWYRVHRMTRSSRTPLKRFVRKGPERTPLANGVVVSGGEVVLARDANTSADPALLMRASSAAAQAQLPLATSTLDRLALECPEPATPWDRETRELFIALLGSGSHLVAVTEALEQAHVWERWIPEWEVVRSAPQRNPIHQYTVDRHLIETTVQACELTTDVRRPDLLLVAALLHDIGKARPGDHSEVGAELARGIATRMGFPDEDVALIELLVSHHLLLPNTATRRDLDDPVTIMNVASAVGDSNTLELLRALTLADQRATGPAVNTPWRERLIEDLVARVARSFDGELPPADPAPTLRQQHVLQAEGLAVTMEKESDGWVVCVGAPDRLGLLSDVAGVLALHRLHIRAARVMTVNGRAAQEWFVRPTFGDPPRRELLAADVEAAGAGNLDVLARLEQRERDYADTLEVPRSPRVIISDQATGHTVIEVRAHDRAGLLYRITAAMSACDVTILGAKISTLGAEAIDAFFVIDRHGAPLSPDRATVVAGAITGALS